MRILDEHEIDALPLRPLIEAVRHHIAADAAARAVAPPRHVVHFGDGDLVFTIGGDESVAGFRAYQTFAKPGHPADDQVIAVWERATGELLGLAVGNRLGALRTGCIGAVAIDTMASRSAKVLAVLGTGRQAETQLLGATAVRAFDEIRIFGRREEALRSFVDRLSPRIGRPLVALNDPRAAVSDADVVILATTSTVPIIDPAWLSPKAHVTTIGPKSKAEHEFPLELGLRARHIATDSPQQIASMGGDHLLAGTGAYDRIAHLGNLIGRFDPDADRGLTLFLSTGLAGTEVACLRAALMHSP
ncbi:MAG: ornithine cyclodeaminase family protein [Devosia sp.]|nr:ornithine cyclodeaminase family protein [Devosia sp.]